MTDIQIVNKYKDCEVMCKILNLKLYTLEEIICLEKDRKKIHETSSIAELHLYLRGIYEWNYDTRSPLERHVGFDIPN